MKLAVPEDAAAGCDDDARANFEAALSALEDVANLTEVPLSDHPYEAVAYTILSAEGASALEDFVDEGKASELADRSGLFGPYAGRAVLATEYLKALRLRGLIAKEMDAVLEPYDAMVAPASGAAPSVDTDFDKSRRGGGDAGPPVSAIGVRGRATRDHGAGRLHRGRPADGHPVHGPRLRRELRAGGGPRVPVADHLARAAPRHRHHVE